MAAAVMATGESGAPEASGGGACSKCIGGLEEDLCQEAYAACQGTPGCQGWLDCVGSCTAENDSVSCYKACDSQFSGSNSPNQNLKSCVCVNCSTECDKLCPCGG